MELPALKYMVRLYGRNYSVISEKSECGRLCYYAMIELWYRAKRFTVTVRKRNENFSMTPTVSQTLPLPNPREFDQLYMLTNFIWLIYLVCSLKSLLS